MGGEWLYRKGLGAARVYGDSMIRRDIMHGDIIVFQRCSLEQVEHGWIGVIREGW
jgi:SOS-response transcriptional repressor LexA